MGEDGELGHRDQRKGMGHALSQAVSSVSVCVCFFNGFASVGFCVSSSTATTVTSMTATTTAARQQQGQQTPIATAEFYDGGNEDVDDDNETRQIEYWSLWR